MAIDVVRVLSAVAVLMFLGLVTMPVVDTMPVPGGVAVADTPSPPAVPQPTPIPPDLKVLETTGWHRDAGNVVFEGAEPVFVDLTSMAVMLDRGITEVFTGDGHFLQVGLGFCLVP